jgi:Cytochrome c
MRKLFTILSIFICVCFFSCLARKSKQALFSLRDEQVAVQKDLAIKEIYTPQPGNAQEGLNYLLHGNFINSGIPASLYHFLYETNFRALVSFGGYNKYEVNGFMKFTDATTQTNIATPNCLHCHAQFFNDSLILGLGNSYSQYQFNQTIDLKLGKQIVKLLYGRKSAYYQNSKYFFDVSKITSPHLVTQTQGVNPADFIAIAIASVRNPITLQLNTNNPNYTIPKTLIPTDVPAWWLAKKKTSLYYNGMAQGNVLKHLMIASLLTIKDTTEAAQIANNMKNVWAYLQNLQPPKYPNAIDTNLANQGENIFINNCSYCHGVYGNNPSYPSKIIALQKIGTDSLFAKQYKANTSYQQWFNSSWFATSANAAYISPQNGYIAPPLDGVWITAPYFHNGSVPTIEAVLNSKLRPLYWKRNFRKTKYNYDKLGWQYKQHNHAGNKQTYNTTLPGYFGDKLTNTERKAVIEYLKTL